IREAGGNQAHHVAFARTQNRLRRIDWGRREIWFACTCEQCDCLRTMWSRFEGDAFQQLDKKRAFVQERSQEPFSGSDLQCMCNGGASCHIVSDLHLSESS